MSVRQQELVFPCHGFDMNRGFNCDFAPQGYQQEVNGENWYEPLCSKCRPGVDGSLSSS